MPDYTPHDWYWIVADDESRYWSSASGRYVTELPKGSGVSRILSEQELNDVLEPYGLLGPTARRKIKKSVVSARLIEAGKMSAAFQVLNSNPTYFARWFVPDRPYVYADDPDALLLLRAIGADADVIMAPE